MKRGELAAAFSDQETLNFLNGVYTPTPDSSNVAGAFWNPDEEILHIAFHGGHPEEGISAYEYLGITYDMAMSFAEADSKGKWVWDILRRNGYPYRIAVGLAGEDGEKFLPAGTPVGPNGRIARGGIREWWNRLKDSVEHPAAKGWWKETFAQTVNPHGTPVGVASIGDQTPKPAGQRRIVRSPPPAEVPVSGRTHTPAQTSKPHKAYSPW